MLRIAMDPAGMTGGFRLKGILVSGLARIVRIKDAMKSTAPTAPTTAAIHPNTSMPPSILMRTCWFSCSGCSGSPTSRCSSAKVLIDEGNAAGQRFESRQGANERIRNLI